MHTEQTIYGSEYNTNYKNWGERVQSDQYCISENFIHEKIKLDFERLPFFKKSLETLVLVQKPIDNNSHPTKVLGFDELAKKINICKWSRIHCLQETVMQDLRQDALMSLLEKSPAEIDAIQNREAYFKKVLFYKTIQYKKNWLLLVELTERIPVEEESELQEQERKDILLNAMECLTPQDKRLLNCLLNGKKAKVVQVELGYSTLEATRSAISRAKGKLKQIVELIRKE